MLPTPSALLLDFGGVIVDAPRRPPAPLELLEHISKLINGVLPLDQIAQDLVGGTKNYAVWRDRAGEDGIPRELSHAQVWDEFVARLWPESARAAIRSEATALSYAWALRPDWTVRPGIPELLALAADSGLPVAIVSNTLCGAAHRDYLRQVGLDERFAVQIYSDEIGLRKPGPQPALLAARELQVPIEHCWFVGDSHRRDMPCARRAGVAAAILMRSERTASETPDSAYPPDLIVENGHELADQLRARIGGCC